MICLPPMLSEPHISLSSKRPIQLMLVLFPAVYLKEFRKALKVQTKYSLWMNAHHRRHGYTINQAGHSEIDCDCSTKRRWQESSIVRAVDVDVQPLASWIAPKMMMMMFPCVPIVSYIHVRVYIVRTRRARERSQTSVASTTNKTTNQSDPSAYRPRSLLPNYLGVYTPLCSQRQFPRYVEESENKQQTHTRKHLTASIYPPQGELLFLAVLSDCALAAAAALALFRYSYRYVYPIIYSPPLFKRKIRFCSCSCCLYHTSMHGLLRCCKAAAHHQSVWDLYCIIKGRSCAFCIYIYYGVDVEGIKNKEKQGKDRITLKNMPALIFNVSSSIIKRPFFFFLLVLHFCLKDQRRRGSSDS